MLTYISGSARRANQTQIAQLSYKDESKKEGKGYGKYCESPFLTTCCCNPMVTMITMDAMVTMATMVNMVTMVTMAVTFS